LQLVERRRGARARGRAVCGGPGRARAAAGGPGPGGADRAGPLLQRGHAAHGHVRADGQRARAAGARAPRAAAAPPARTLLILQCAIHMHCCRAACGDGAVLRFLAGHTLCRSCSWVRCRAAAQRRCNSRRRGAPPTRRCGGAQYGGSEAHAAVFQRQRGDWQPATRLRDKLISLRRAISNGWRAPAAFYEQMGPGGVVPRVCYGLLLPGNDFRGFFSASFVFFLHLWYDSVHAPTSPARLPRAARAARPLRSGEAAKPHARARQRRPPRPTPDAAARARRAQVRRRAAGRHQPVPGPLPAAAGRARAVGPGHRPLPALRCAGRQAAGVRVRFWSRPCQCAVANGPPWRPEGDLLLARGVLSPPVLCGARGDAAVAMPCAAVQQCSLQGMPGGGHYEPQRQRRPGPRARRPEPALAAAQHLGGPGLRGGAAGRAIRPAGAPPRAVPGRARAGHRARPGYARPGPQHGLRLQRRAARGARGRPARGRRGAGGGRCGRAARCGRSRHKGRGRRRRH